MTEEKQFKQMVRDAAQRKGKSYAATRARLDKRRGATSLIENAQNALQGLSDRNIRWIFRHDPELASMLVTKCVRNLTRKQYELLEVTIEELADSEIRPILTADTIIEQFDSHYARGRWSSPNLSSRTLFDAGVEPMYFRVLRDKIEPCIGELVSASNPVSLFRTEIEPLLRHAQQARSCELIELLEIVPRLSLTLGPYLRTSGWCRSDLWPESRGYKTTWARAYCRLGMDGASIPGRALRNRLAQWNEVQRKHFESLCAASMLDLKPLRSTNNQ